MFITHTSSLGTDWHKQSMTKAEYDQTRCSSWNCNHVLPINNRLKFMGAPTTWSASKYIMIWNASTETTTIKPLRYNQKNTNLRNKVRLLQISDLINSLFQSQGGRSRTVSSYQESVSLQIWKICWFLDHIKKEGSQGHKNLHFPR